MNKFKLIGMASTVTGGISNQDWISVIGVILAILGILQDFLRDREKNKKEG